MIGQPMVTRRRVASVVLGLLVGLVVVGVAVAGPGAPGPLSLNLPSASAVVVQNDPATTGCAANATSLGFSGFVIDFSWTAPQVKGVHRYEVVMQHGNSPRALDVIVTTGTSYHWDACSSYVIDANLSDWHWQVTALGNGGHKALAISEARPISFAACRLADGTTACSG